MGTLDEILAELREMKAENRKILTENGKLRERIAQLESDLDRATRENKQQAAPFRKPVDRKKPPEEHKKPGRKPGHEASFRKPPDGNIQRVVDVPLEACPCCRGELEQRASHEHFVVDVPRLAPTWTKFVTQSGYCRHCKARRSSRHAEMPSLAVGAAGVSFGPNLVTLTVVLKTQSGVTFRKVQRFLKEWFVSFLQRSLVLRQNLIFG